MSFNTFCGQDPLNPLTYNRVLLRFQELGGGGGGVATVNAGVNINITGPPANPIVNLRNPLNATLNMGVVGIQDSVASTGGANDVLTCGAGNTTLWQPSAALTNYPVAFVPYYNEVALPLTTFPINSGAAGLFTTADLIRGGITPRVDEMYDPVAAAAIPTIIPDFIEVEVHLEMVNLKNQFTPLIPNGQLLNDAANVIGTITGGAIASCPTQIVYHFTYTINGGASNDFTTPQFYSSVYSEIPAVLGGFYPAFGAQSFSTQFSGKTLLDLTGRAAGDLIGFQLWAYTQNDTPSAKIVDTATIASFGEVSIKTSMFRG